MDPKENAVTKHSFLWSPFPVPQLENSLSPDGPPGHDFSDPETSSLTFQQALELLPLPCSLKLGEGSLIWLPLQAVTSSELIPHGVHGFILLKKIDLAVLKIKTFLWPCLADQDTIISDPLSMLNGSHYYRNNCMLRILKKNSYISDRQEMRKFSLFNLPETTTLSVCVLFSWCLSSLHKIKCLCLYSLIYQNLTESIVYQLSQWGIYWISQPHTFPPPSVSWFSLVILFLFFP